MSRRESRRTWPLLQPRLRGRGRGRGRGQSNMGIVTGGGEVTDKENNITQASVDMEEEAEDQQFTENTQKLGANDETMNNNENGLQERDRQKQNINEYISEQLDSSIEKDADHESSLQHELPLGLQENHNQGNFNFQETKHLDEQRQEDELLLARAAVEREQLLKQNSQDLLRVVQNQGRGVETHGLGRSKESVQHLAASGTQAKGLFGQQNNKIEQVQNNIIGMVQKSNLGQFKINNEQQFNSVHNESYEMQGQKNHVQLHDSGREQFIPSQNMSRFDILVDGHYKQLNSFVKPPFTARPDNRSGMGMEVEAYHRQPISGQHQLTVLQSSRATCQAPAHQPSRLNACGLPSASPQVTSHQMEQQNIQPQLRPHLQNENNGPYTAALGYSDQLYCVGQQKSAHHGQPSSLVQQQLPQTVTSSCGQQFRHTATQKIQHHNSRAVPTQPLAFEQNAQSYHQQVIVSKIPAQYNDVAPQRLMYRQVSQVNLQQQEVEGEAPSLPDSSAVQQLVSAMMPAVRSTVTEALQQCQGRHRNTAPAQGRNNQQASQERFPETLEDCHRLIRSLRTRLRNSQSELRIIRKTFGGNPGFRH